MARLIRNGRTRTVQNLGWLLRNWQAVDSFTVRRPVDTLSTDPCPADATLIAHLRDGGEYSTGYQSASALWRFLHRPVFLGLSVDWYGVRAIIGAAGEVYPDGSSRLTRDPNATAPGCNGWPMARQAAIAAGVRYLSADAFDRC